MYVRSDNYKDELFIVTELVTIDTVTSNILVQYDSLFCLMSLI